MAENDDLLADPASEPFADQPDPQDQRTRDVGSLVGDWLSWSEVGEQLGVPVSKVRQMIKEHQLAALVPEPGAGQKVPAAFLDGNEIVKGVPGLLTLLLALRSRTYANGAQALALLVCSLVAAATLAAGALAAVGPGVPALGFVAVALALGTVALLLGVAVPGRRFSPVARRAVDIAEAVGIAAVLPVALAVMDLYTAMRLLSGG